MSAAAAATESLPGSEYPLGATVTSTGTNFAVMRRRMLAARRRAVQDLVDRGDDRVG